MGNLNNIFFIFSVMLMKKRAPVLGGSFALWGGLFNSTECVLIHMRNKEDYINPIVSGFVTGGLLAARGYFVNLKPEQGLLLEMRFLEVFF